MRLFVRLSYDGSGFSGWQSQTNAPSVQASLERALSIAFGEQTEVTGAGRTDAGVNARNYFAHFDVQDEGAIDAAGGRVRFIRKINAILPPQICVHSLYRVDDSAHARFDATSRTYRYHVHTGKDPFAKYSYLYTFPLDVAAMNEAAALIPGTRDFSCFEKLGGGNATSICTVTEARWDEVDDCHLVFTVTANRFLRNMVRAMVGTLLDVGRGRMAPSDIIPLIESADRQKAGQSVPGEALFLERIEYPYELTII